MHVRRALALALVVPLLLAGCSEDEPEPQMPDPPASSEPSPSPSETETPEAESPEEFIRRWVAAGDEMQRTGEVNEFRSMSRGCEACAGLVSNVKRIYDAGGSIEFEGSDIATLKRVAEQPPSFHLDLNTPQTIVLTAEGERQQTHPAGVGKYIVTLAKAGAGWRVAHYGRR